MEIAIRNIGNSKGVVLPKPFLAQVGLDGQATATIEVENGSIVLRKPAKSVRAGWAEAAAGYALSTCDGIQQADVVGRILSDAQLGE